MIPKKNFKDFYDEVRQLFPKISELSTWYMYDWGPDGHENSFIMSELSEEVAKWVKNGHLQDSKLFMDVIERYFYEGKDSVTSMIYTDFLVTITEISDWNLREEIKRMMGPETQKSYTQLLQVYKEAD